jgi:hypothetical protein
MGVYEQGSGPTPENESGSGLILDLPASRILNHKFLMFISYLDYGIFLNSSLKKLKIIIRTGVMFSVSLQLSDS